MTPAQQVALDAMRSAWPEEVVQRMLRAARPFDIDAVRDMAEPAYLAWRRSERNNEPTWAQVVVAVLGVGLGPSALDPEVRARFDFVLASHPPRA